VVPIRTDKARVPAEDDVVAVDADERGVVIVTTHDETEACPEGRGGDSVHALRIPRTGGSAASLELAKGACSRDVGPFWSSPMAGSVVVGWVERASRPSKTSAPIAGLAYRRIGEGGATARIAQPADAIADAGCDAERCYAVALVRESGSDGMKPEAIRVIAYP
jgi:hypothetical protein